MIGVKSAIGFKILRFIGYKDSSFLLNAKRKEIKTPSFYALAEACREEEEK
jgi:hypothetical protein